MTRVLMTADTIGGVWTYALDVARALPECDFHLATMGGLLSPTQAAGVRALSNVTLHESAFRLEWMPDPWDDVARAGEWLRTLARETQPDVVHMNGFIHAALPFGVPVVTVGHSCVLSWFEAVRGADAPPEWARYAEAVRAGLAASAVVAAPSQAMLSALERHYGPLPPASCVIANARDGAQFSPGEKEPFIFSAGRVWDEAKNIRTLAQAALGLPWPVRVAGDAAGPGGEWVSPPGVEMLGHLPPPEVARQMGRAAIYALPARYEPFGLSILEAALSGCALVLGDIDSLREVWANAAVYVPPQDADALHRALLMLCRDDAARNSLAARAQARAALYSPVRLASAYRAVYAQAQTAFRSQG